VFAALEKSMKRILVIDNEPYIQEVAQICLETIAGWTVDTAGSGLDGIEIALKKRPDAILLDVMMPEVDGLTTFANLQDNPVTRDIPVFLLTAKVQASDLRYYAELGIKNTIAKPFDPMQLAQQISSTLDWTD
jgi:CheY-like chemotaxis protein